MNILLKYTAKVLWLNKKRTAVTIFGVILSGALICGVILLGVSFQKMMIDREIAYSGNFHARFQGVPVEKAKYFEQNAAVSLAMLSTDPAPATFGSRNEFRPYAFVSGFDAASFQNQPIQITQGRLPQTAGEIVISEAMAAGSKLDLQLGSQLTLTSGARANADGETLSTYYSLEEGETFTPSETKTYTVVGIMASPFDEGSMQAGFAAFTSLDAASLAPGSTVNVEVLLRNPRQIYRIAPQIAQDAGLAVDLAGEGLPSSVTIEYNDGMLMWMGIKSQSSYTEFFLVIIGIIIALIVVGSGLVIFNAFSISVGERKKQFGMFASVGATAAQIRQSIWFEALIIGLIGIPLGILGGIVGVGITLAYAENIIAEVVGVSQGMQLVVSPLVIGLTVLFSAATILFSAWVPARRAALVSPVEAIRLNEEIHQEKRANRLKTSPLVRRLFGFEGELALKSLKRDRKRYRTTVLSLMISIILFVAFNAMMDYTSTSAHMDNQAVNYDLSIYLMDGDEVERDFVWQAVKLPQVDAYSYIRRAQFFTELDPEQLTDQAVQAMSETSTYDFTQPGGRYQVEVIVCTLGPQEFERYTRSLGLDPTRLAQPGERKAILINQNRLRQGKLFEFEMFNLKPGDPMAVNIYTGGESDPPATVKFDLAAVTAELPLGVYQPDFGSLLVVSDETFDAVMTGLGLEDRSYSMVYIQANDETSLVEELNQLYKSTVGGILSYYSPAEANHQENMTELMVNLFFYGFLALITLVGVTNIVNTINTNIQLRRREFAMLKSVGLTPGGFLRILRYESLFYGLQALGLGLPIAIALSGLIYLQFGRVSAFGFSLPWAAIAWCVVGVLAIVFVTMMISGTMIRNDNIVDTIKEENL